MEFSNRELNYIVDAVYQYDDEYEYAPGDLLVRLETWRENMKELCHHTNTKIIYGFERFDGTVPNWTYCYDCSTRTENEPVQRETV